MTNKEITNQLQSIAVELKRWTKVVSDYNQSYGDNELESAVVCLHAIRDAVIHLQSKVTEKESK